MFGTFSWGNYFLFIGFLFFAYFIVIGVFFYRKEILAMAGFKNPLQSAIDAPIRRKDLLPMVHELVAEMGAMIRTRAETKTVVPELLEAIKEKLRVFSILEPTEYKAKINLYIQQELEIHGIVDISLQQIEQCWKYP